MSSSTNWMDPYSPDITKGDTYYQGQVSFNYEQVHDLCDFILTGRPILQMFSQAKDWISSLMYYPFNLNLGSGDTTEHDLWLGPYTDQGTSTGVKCYLFDTQQTGRPTLKRGFIYMGECKINRHFNNFADYNGYTEIKVYLPYYGYVDVSANEVMGKWLQFRLKIDFYTGEGTWYVGVSDSSIPPPTYEGEVVISPIIIGSQSDIDANTRILSTHTCPMGRYIPISSTDFTDGLRNILIGGLRATGAIIAGYLIAGAVGGGVGKAVGAGAAATGVAGGAAATITSTSQQKIVETTRNKDTGRQITQATTTKTFTHTRPVPADNSAKHFGAYMKYRVASTVMNEAVDAVNAMHVGVQSDKTANVNLIMNGPKSVKVVIKRPRLQPIDPTYKKLYGLPEGKTTPKLSNYGGYTEINDVHIEGEAFSQATIAELEMLDKALKSGIIL